LQAEVVKLSKLCYSEGIGTYRSTGEVTLASEEYLVFFITCCLINPVLPAVIKLCCLLLLLICRTLLSTSNLHVFIVCQCRCSELVCFIRRRCIRLLGTSRFFDHWGDFTL